MRIERHKARSAKWCTARAMRATWRRLGKLDIRESKDASKPPFVVISGLQGTCITVDEIRRQMSELTPPVPPSNPVANATITREAKLAGHRMGLSFKWSNPDCLESIVPRMD